MKKSIARILVFIDTTPRELHYARKMSLKLKMDYQYMLQILAEMREIELIVRVYAPANPTRSYHQLTVLGRAELERAKELLSGEQENGKRNKSEPED